MTCTLHVAWDDQLACYDFGRLDELFDRETVNADLDHHGR
jgi:hypothetical protein